MKKRPPAIARCLKKMDSGWQQIHTKKQQRIIVYAFLVYLLLTLIVIGKACLETGKATGVLKMDHIENPVLKGKAPTGRAADSLLKTFKTKTYGR